MLTSIILITISALGLIFWIIPQAWARKDSWMGGRTDVIILGVSLLFLLILFLTG